MGKYITAKEASHKFNKTAHQVRYLQREGKVRSKEINGLIHVSLDDLNTFYGVEKKERSQAPSKTIIEPSPSTNSDTITKTLDIVNTKLNEEYKKQIERYENQIKSLQQTIKEKDDYIKEIIEKYDARYVEYQDQMKNTQKALENSQVLQLRQAEELANLNERLSAPKRKKLLGFIPL